MFVKLNPKYGDKLFLDFCTLSTLFHMLIPNALQSASHYLLTFLGLLFSALLVNVLSVAMIGLDQIFTMLTLRKSPKIHT
ncbi:hypothetical protein FACS189459_6820 [Bacilli bacterium]|nr:hypothetical protein FACS189459_6820 [Bacilli bacterium]